VSAVRSLLSLYDSCHDGGKDVVFQDKPAHDMVRGEHCTSIDAKAVSL